MRRFGARPTLTPTTEPDISGERQRVDFGGGSLQEVMTPASTE
jgi:hypothetical protein